MVVVKNEDESIMAEVVAALMDDNKTVRIETINASTPDNRILSLEDTPQIPTKKEEYFNGMSTNRAHMTSATIGKDISVKLQGDYFIVRTPHGESKFDKSYSSDFFYVWTAIGFKYDKGTLENSTMLKSMQDHMKSKKVQQVLSGDITPKQSKSDKLKQATNILKSKKTLQIYANQKQND